VPSLFVSNAVSPIAKGQKLIAPMRRERGGELPLIIQVQRCFGLDLHVTNTMAADLTEKYNFRNI
jgi:hypothetical protein